MAALKPEICRDVISERRIREKSWVGQALLPYLCQYSVPVLQSKKRYQRGER